MHRDDSSTEGVPTRRAFVVAVGTVGTVALAGCLGDDEDHPEPIALDGDKECDQCGMVIEDYPGPTGQSFYEDDVPEGRDEMVDGEHGPAWFCSLPCLYTYDFDQEDFGHEPIVQYATDYSSVDWEVEEDGVGPEISAHLEAEAYADVTDLSFVVNSDIVGAMGEDLVGFSDADDADSFADEYGGEVIGHGDVSRELIDGLGAV